MPKSAGLALNLVNLCTSDTPSVVSAANDYVPSGLGTLVEVSYLHTLDNLMTLGELAKKKSHSCFKINL